MVTKRRFQVRRQDNRWEVGEFDGRSWVRRFEFPTWWQAMLQVTGDLPYGADTVWTPARRPVWCN